MNNVKIIRVVFNNRLQYRLNTPSFLQLFGKIPEIANKTAIPNVSYVIRTNHVHYAKIVEQYATYGCIDSLTDLTNSHISMPITIK